MKQSQRLQVSKFPGGGGGGGRGVGMPQTPLIRAHYHTL